MRAPSAPPESPAPRPATHRAALPPTRPLAPVVAERRRCPGCDAPVTGRFCAECGQSHQDVRVRFARWMRDYVDDTFHLDSRFFRSLWALVRRPGQLTRAYVEGERSVWVRPFRLYLMASALYFLCFGLFGTANALNVQVSAGGTNVVVVGSGAAPQAPATAPAPGDAAGKPSSRLKQRLDQFVGQDPERARTALVRGLGRQLPKAMFVLVPVFALLLKALYRRRYYAEHFVFALHVHAFSFLVAGLLLPVSAHVVPLPGAAALASGVHLFLAQRRVYDEGRVRTLLKTLALGATYAVVGALALVAIVLLTILGGAEG